MGLLTRFTSVLFGSTAGADRLGEFGSLQEGSPIAYAGTVATPGSIQTLSNWATGLDGCVVGAGSIPIQDLNAILFTQSYFTTYLLQQGIGDWDSGTTYGSNGLCMGSTGIVYQCTAASSLGDAPPGSTWTVFQSAQKNPTTTRLTSGSSTYTPPAGVTYLKVKMIGGGGGGGGAGNAPTTGSPGSATTLGTIATAYGGAGGVTYNGTAPAGGSTATTGVTVQIALNGGYGVPGGFGAVSSIDPIGQGGAASPFGGAGGGGNAGGGSGTAAVPNSGSGGGGGGLGGAGDGFGAGGGGAAGGYLEFIITTVATSYTYVIGLGGGGGASTPNGGAGGAGGSGIIVIEEHYGA